MTDMGMPISVSYGALQEASSVIRSSSNSIGDRMEQLTSELRKLQWDGDDRRAYDDVERRIKQSIEAMNQILMQISQAVETAKMGYEATERAGAQAWG
jgi:WXG100 family type VII secretion target